VFDGAADLSGAGSSIRAVASVVEGNDASLRVLQKLGFTIVSIEKGARTFYHMAIQNSIPG